LAIYKTVMIIFPLNLQAITITSDVVKWRGGEVFSENNVLTSAIQISLI